jgi:peptidyl-prolyl cis-trans isomerase D
MNAFLRRHQKSIFFATITVFLGGMVVGFGGYWFTDRDMQGVVARVGTTKIEYQELQTRVDLYADRMREQGVAIDDAKLTELRRELLNSLLVDNLLAIKADRMGIVVTDQELARDIRSDRSFQRDGRFDQETYFNAVRQALRISPQQFEDERRTALKSSHVKRLLARTVKISPTELRAEYAATHNGSMKGFEKEAGAFAQTLEQARAGDLINRALRQMQAEVETVNLLGRFETGS